MAELLRDEALLFFFDETVRPEALLRLALLLLQDDRRLFAERPAERRALARPRLTVQREAGR
ncbi:MAG TPA: hypothetical protein VE861_11230 [Gemmatimonadaceae bacterium]|nr:hypothetical protein [Gemmatimonadaceae bacterium]